MGEGILLIIGIMTLILSILKPNFYWNSRKAMRSRRLFGDAITQLMYIGIGVALIIVSIVTMIQGK